MADGPSGPPAPAVPYVAIATHTPADGWCIKSEAAIASGNARTIALQILSRLPPPARSEPYERSYAYGDGHIFHFAAQARQARARPNNIFAAFAPVHHPALSQGGAEVSLCLERGLSTSDAFALLSRAHDISRGSRTAEAAAAELDGLVVAALTSPPAPRVPDDGRSEARSRGPRGGGGGSHNSSGHNNSGRVEQMERERPPAQALGELFITLRHASLITPAFANVPSPMARSSAKRRSHTRCSRRSSTCALSSRTRLRRCG